MKISKLKINISDFSIQINDKIEHFPKTFFYLCTYLAYERKYQRKGLIDVDRISQLPVWREKNQETTKKEINRYIRLLEKQGKKIINYKHGLKVKGPFGLINLKKIAFDKTQKEIKKFLDLEENIPPELEDKEKEDFYNYTRLLIEGINYFDQGEVKEALNRYEEILKTPLFSEKFPEHEVNTLGKKATILERLGDWEGAFKVSGEALKRIEDGGIPPKYEPYLKSKLYSYVGFLHARKRDNSSIAKKYYEKVRESLKKSCDFSKLGDIHLGLGLISLHSEKDREKEALVYFEEALQCFLLSKNVYAIQYIYFYIADCFYEIYIRNGRQKVYLDKAEKWAKRGKDLIEISKTGQETGQTENLLSKINLEKNELEEADRYAKKAEEIAIKAKNNYDIAMANKSLGLISIKKKEFQQAEACLKKSRDMLKDKKLGLKKEVKEIDDYLKSIKNITNNKKPQ